jgi:hypothetical protein
MPGAPSGISFTKETWRVRCGFKKPRCLDTEEKEGLESLGRRRPARLQVRATPGEPLKDAAEAYVTRSCEGRGVWGLVGSRTMKYDQIL